MKAEFTFTAAPSDVMMLVFFSLLTRQSIIQSNVPTEVGGYMSLFCEDWAKNYLKRVEQGTLPEIIFSSLRQWSNGESQNNFTHENNPYPERDRYEGEPLPERVYVRICDDQHPPNDVCWENVYCCEGATLRISSGFDRAESEVTLTRLSNGKYSLSAAGDRKNFQISAEGQIGREIVKESEDFGATGAGRFKDFQVLKSETSETFAFDKRPHNLFLLPAWKRVQDALRDCLSPYSCKAIYEAVDLFR